MTDVHCHVSASDSAVAEFLIGRDFAGVHPWDAATWDAAAADGLRARLTADPALGVGEIGLDRLKARDVSPLMRTAFEEQLKLAAEFRRPVVLHGAKCWGQVVRTIVTLGVAEKIPALLFHGFSRSDGLVPDIVKLNGFVSVGPAVLNDHAVNYRKLACLIPADRLVVETDRTPENAAECPSVRDVLAKLAELRGVSAAELERTTDENARRFRP